MIRDHSSITSSWFWPFLNQPPYQQTSSFPIPTLNMTSSFPHTHPPIYRFFFLSSINKAKIRQGLFLLEKDILHTNSGSFFQKKRSVTWIKLISDILERMNRFQVSFDTDDGHCIKKGFFKKIPTFFSLYIFWSHQHIATPTHPLCHQTSSFGHPTHLLFDDTILEWSLM